MAFNFARYKTKTTTTSNNNNSCPDQQIPTRLKQLNNSTKSYPNWLKDNATNLKQLPGIYLGVLGQVQLQTDFSSEFVSKNNNCSIKLSNTNKKISPHEYMNSFTDTDRVKQLLSMSRLSNETLATIWAHVNKTFPGRLTNREVCLALGLIALFQNLELEDLIAGQRIDPFNQIKIEKKPPIPKLYPSCVDQISLSTGNSRITSSNSMPNELNKTNGSLIDLNDDESSESFAAKQIDSSSLVNRTNSNMLFNFGDMSETYRNLVNLIDTDGDRYGLLVKQCQIWLKIMLAMRNVFKRSFDILNVENSRHSALEALSSREGIEFCKNLCLCYPLVHNIHFKVDELARKHLFDSTQIDKNYIKKIDNLMVSVNEYWAVLINLFHESGQTDFIELIMDGLNKTNDTVSSQNIEELLDELDSANKRDTCGICHTKFYLVNIGDALEKRELSEKDLKLVLSNEVLSNDDCFYYHARCANFWLNNVDPECSKLPYYDLDNSTEILKPTSN